MYFSLKTLFHLLKYFQHFLILFYIMRWIHFQEGWIKKNSSLTWKKSYLWMWPRVELQEWTVSQVAGHGGEQIMVFSGNYKENAGNQYWKILKQCQIKGIHQNTLRRIWNYNSPVCEYIYHRAAMSNAPMIKAPNTIPNTAAIPNPGTSEGPIAQKREKKNNQNLPTQSLSESVKNPLYFYSTAFCRTCNYHHWS